MNQSDWLKLFHSAEYTNSTHFRASRGAVTRSPSEAISGAATRRPSGVGSGILPRRELSYFPYSNSEQALMVALSTLLVVRMVHVLVQLTSRPISSPVICVVMAPSRQDHISFAIGFVKSKQNLPLFVSQQNCHGII